MKHICCDQDYTGILYSKFSYLLIEKRQDPLERISILVDFTEIASDFTEKKCLPLPQASSSPSSCLPKERQIKLKHFLN